MRIANFLPGSVDADSITYVSAEMAYLMLQLGDRQVNDESEFYNLVNGINCSLELKQSLCEDAKTLGC